MNSRSGFSRIDLLVVIGALAAIGALFLPSLSSGRRVSNERAVMTNLRALAAAEADYRANDRDANGVNDFWTGDVKSLYTMTSAQERTGQRPPSQIRLIELDVAASDADGRYLPAGGLNVHLEPFARPDPHHGYRFIALEKDRSEGGSEGVSYRQETGGRPSMGACHHLQNFGFCALPVSKSQGMRAYMINENNPLFGCTIQLPYRDIWSGYESPPGLDAVPPGFKDWPRDDDLRAAGWHAG